MATNKIYNGFATQQVFDNTTTPALTMKNIANGAGRVSAQWDRSTGSLPMWFKWEAVMKAAAAVTIGLPWRIYAHVAQTASANVDVATTDTALTVETQLLNFRLLGSVYASSNAVGPFYAAGLIWIPGRYVSLGWWNASGQTQDNVDSTSKIILTPIFDDIQAAA